ncbi:MAG: hypothetical protein BalsKO_22310 [Balneolaceae bacterium]
MPDKIYSEDEIQQIIKRAAELQKEEQTSSAKKEAGLTMDELLQIGDEAGLDMDLIKTAALEYREKNITRRSGLTDTHIFEEREINTEAYIDDVWNEITTELKHFVGGETFGKTKEDFSKKEWINTSMSGIETVASLSKRENGVRLRVSQRVGLASTLTEGVSYGFILTLILFGFGFAFLNPSFFEGSALFASLFTVSSILVYTLDVNWRKKKLKRLKELVNRIVEQVPTKAPLKKRASNSVKIEIESEDVYLNEEKDDSKLKNDLRKKT